MLDAKLDEHRIYGADLNALSPARVAYFGCFDMVIAIWLEEGECGESFNQLNSSLWACKSLQQFLQYQACSEHLICTFKSVLQSPDFSNIHCRITAKGKRPDASIDK